MARALSGTENYLNPRNPRHTGYLIAPKSVHLAPVSRIVCEAIHEAWLLHARGTRVFGAIR